MKSISRTIVGGRSGDDPSFGRFPRGIEILLKKAKVNLSFRSFFLSDPFSAAASIELDLKDNEKKILSSITDALQTLATHHSGWAV